MKLPFTKTDFTDASNLALTNATMEANFLHDHVEQVAGQIITKTLTCLPLR